MARQTDVEDIYFQHRGAEERLIYWRIRPQAIRWQQQGKRTVSDTLGGWYRSVMYSDAPASNGLMLADLTIEGTTGVAYRTELEKMMWVWRHQSDRQPNGQPAETLFFNLIELGVHQGIARDTQQTYSIDISQFAYDESARSQGEISFTFRCKILEDVFAGISQDPPANLSSIPSIDELNPLTQTLEPGLFTPNGFIP